MGGTEQVDIRKIRNIMLLAAGIVILSLFVPFVRLFILFFLPLPVILLRLVTTDFRFLAAVFVLILLPLGIASGGSGWDLVFCTSMLLYGYAMGEGWRRGVSRESFVALGVLVSMILWVAGLVFFSVSHGMNPFAFLEKQVAIALESVFHMYGEMGVPEDVLVTWKDAAPLLQYRMARLFPAMMASLQILVGWLNLLLARDLAGRMGAFAPDLGIFRNWGVPRIFMWGVVASGVLFLLPLAQLQILGTSGLMLLFVLYFLQGMAVMAFFFHTKRIPLLAQVMIYTLIAVQPVLFVPVFILGLCDTWFNFRKRIQAPPVA